MQFLQTVIGVVAAMRDLAIVHFPGEGGSGLPADGRPSFEHADRPNFGAAAMGGVVPSRRLDHHRANLAETSLTGFALYYKLRGIARAAKSCRIALKPLSEPVRSTRAGRYFCNSVLIPAGRFGT
jgi:hypothetical protein